jgi:hypothetical protein
MKGEMMLTLYLGIGAFLLVVFFIMSLSFIVDAQNKSSLAFCFLSFTFLTLTAILHQKMYGFLNLLNLSPGIYLFILFVELMVLSIATIYSIYWGKGLGSNMNFSTLAFIVLLFISTVFQGYKTWEVYDKDIRAKITEHVEEEFEKDLKFFTENEPNDPNMAVKGEGTRDNPMVVSVNVSANPIDHNNVNPLF